LVHALHVPSTAVYGYDASEQRPPVETSQPKVGAMSPPSQPQLPALVVLVAQSTSCCSDNGVNVRVPSR